MKVKEIEQTAIERLKQANAYEAVLKAKLTIAFVLKVPKEFLISHSDNEINENNVKLIYDAVEKLAQGYPLEHITHKKEFMKLNFYVDENVLIPRQDTEILVEEVIKRCKCGKILDLCTGSGAIAVSLAKYIPSSNVFASDISQKALEIARKNAQDNNTDIIFFESDLFENIKEKDFDVIVSNPPYIETDVINILQEDVKKEPHIALDGGIDGLDFYRIIAKKAKKYLKHNGLLALEIGFNQAEAVTKLLTDYGDVEVIKDLSRE